MLYVWYVFHISYLCAMPYCMLWLVLPLLKTEKSGMKWAGQNGWTIRIKATGTQNQWGKGSIISKWRIINLLNLMCFLVCHQQCSMWKAISLWASEPEKGLTQANRPCLAKEKSCWIPYHNSSILSTYIKKGLNVDSIAESNLCVIQYTLEETAARCESHKTHTWSRWWTTILHLQLSVPKYLEILLPAAVPFHSHNSIWCNQDEHIPKLHTLHEHLCTFDTLYCYSLFPRHFLPLVFQTKLEVRKGSTTKHCFMWLGPHAPHIPLVITNP